MIANGIEERINSSDGNLPASGFFHLLRTRSIITSLIFLVLGLAMCTAWAGHRKVGMILFTAASVLALLWFNHHMTDPLMLDF